jgi:hypothetical protein
MSLKLRLLPGTFTVCRLEPDAALPAWALAGDLVSISRTPEDLSIVCPEAHVPQGILAEKGWRCLKIQGPLPFSMTGILASLVNPLAEAGISLFAFSTYDTDYVLVKDSALDRARTALIQAGHSLKEP